MQKTFKLSLIISLLALLVIYSFTGIAAEQTTVKIAMKTEPSSLHPISSQGTEPNILLSQICDPLLTVDEEGNFSTEGGVVEEYEVQEDGKVYIFEIKKGIEFHNGEPLTAEDVKFNFEAWADKDLGSPYRSYYTVIEDLELLDEYTLKVTLEKNDVTFLSYCNFKERVIPKDYVQEVGWEEFAKNPVGSGPYKFVEYVSGQRIVMERNEDYWGDKPAIDRVEFRFYPESNSAVMALMTKEIDYLLEPSAEEFKRLKDYEGIASSQYKKFQDDRICFNKREDSVFSDVRLRKAVAYAVNREEVMMLTRGDMAVPAVGRIPDFHPASAPEANAYEYNPEKARELLAEAGYPDGLETQIYVASNHQDRVQEAQLIQQQLAEVGIKAEVVTLEWGTYLDVTAKGEAPMFRERWLATIPSPYDFVEVYHSESSWNTIFGTYHNPEVDSLLEELVKTVDNGERWGIYREVQEIVMDDVASYPLYWPIAGVVYNDELHIPEDCLNPFNKYIDPYKWSFK